MKQGNKCLFSKEIGRKISTGILVSAVEKQRFSSHLSKCETCRVDVALSGLILNSDDEIENEFSMYRKHNQIIETARKMPSTEDLRALTELEALPGRSPNATPTKTTLLWGLAAGFVIICTAGALWFSNMESFPTGTADQSNVQNKQMSVSSVVANDNKPKQPAPATAPPPMIGASPAPKDNSSIVHLAKGIQLMMGTGTLFSVLENKEDLLHLQLKKGTVFSEVNPHIPHPTLRISTSAGVITVVGTVFRVTASDDVRVSVLRGAVSVTNSRGQLSVTSGNEAHVAELHQTSMSEKTRLSLAQQLTALSKSPVPPVAQSTPSPAGVKTSSTLVNSNDHFNQLLFAAREQKKRGDYQGAVNTYSQVISRYPNRAESKAAHVIVGNLQLKLGLPAAAEHHFVMYEKMGEKSLLQEALHGKIRALRGQRRTAEELKALHRFRTLFPSSLHAQAVGNRIAEIELGNAHDSKK